MTHRIGFGTDIHRLVAGRPLVLGGVVIDSELGGDGHSDADVLIHAVTDAIFGALALGDIGTHFPNDEERWRNAESSIFLLYAVGLMKRRGFEIANIDSTIDLEKPKLRPFIDEMRENLAAAAKCDDFPAGQRVFLQANEAAAYVFVVMPTCLCKFRTRGRSLK